MRSISAKKMLAFGAVFVGVCAAGMAAGSGQAPAQSKTTTLVTPMAFGSHVPGLGTPTKELAKRLKERSNGTLLLELKEPGDGTAPYEILDKVSDGDVDAGYATTAYWAAKLPAASLFAGFPFGPDAKGYLDWFNRGDGRTLYQEMYDQAKVDVHVVPCAFGGAEAGGWFSKEITSKEDLEGLRIRIFGLGARVMMRLGAVPVLVPGSQIVEAFKEGKIEAAEAYTPAVDRANGIQDGAKLLYQPGWSQPATVFEFLINKDRWAALGPEHQSLIESTCGEMLQSTLSTSANLQAAALSAFVNKDGVQLKRLPEDVLEALREAWREVAREEGVRDYLFQEIFDDIETFRSGGKPEKEGLSEAEGAGNGEEGRTPAQLPPGRPAPSGP